MVKLIVSRVAGGIQIVSDDCNSFSAFLSIEDPIPATAKLAKAINIEHEMKMHMLP